jgi:hypothetical protein
MLAKLKAEVQAESFDIVHSVFRQKRASLQMKQCLYTDLYLTMLQCA